MKNWMSMKDEKEHLLPALAPQTASSALLCSARSYALNQTILWIQSGDRLLQEKKKQKKEKETIHSRHRKVVRRAAVQSKHNAQHWLDNKVKNWLQKHLPAKLLGNYLSGLLVHSYLGITSLWNYWYTVLKISCLHMPTSFITFKTSK